MDDTVGRAAWDGVDGKLPRRVRFLGHATVLIDLDDTRILADPLLRNRVSGLFWRHPTPRVTLDHPVDAVLISHMHQDHLDVPSLRQLGRDVRLLVPSRAGAFLARRGFHRVREARAGDEGQSQGGASQNLPGFHGVNISVFCVLIRAASECHP